MSHCQVQPTSCWPARLTDRGLHFATFDLGLLYCMQAARLISGIEARFELLLYERGSAAVRDHLRQGEESRRQAGLNSWQAACYEALAASDWFCAGGFRF